MADQGKIFTDKHDRNLLSALHSEDFIDYNSQTINENISVSEMFELFKKSNKNIFAVVDDKRALRGMFSIDDIRPYLFGDHDVPKNIIQIMKAPPAVFHKEDKPLEILQVFDDTGVWNLPVVDEENRFIGFISKSSILMGYRQLLKEYSE